MQKDNRIKATLHQLADLAKPSFADGELHKIQDYEEYAIKDGYNTAKTTVGCIADNIVFSFERARYLVLSWAWEQENLTGKPHNPITEDGTRVLFTSIFLKPLVYSFVLDKNPAEEFFKFKQYYQIVRATFNDFANWVSSKG